MNFAANILEQLGGKKFIAMTGSKNFLYEDATETNATPWLRMDLASNAAGVNRLKISLNSTDTYTLHFYRQTISKKTLDVTISKEQKFENVYFDMLQSIFTQVTGLRTSL